MGTHQPVIARWENESTRPNLETVVKAVEACGFALHLELRPIEHDTVLVRRELAKRPTERLASLVESVSAFDAMAAAAHD